MLKLAALVTLMSLPATAADTLYVRAGRLLDVEAGRVLTNQLVQIEDGKIRSVGEAREIPAGASVVDWSRYTVLPGLIDLHTHLIGDIQGSNIAAPLLSSGARDALLGAGHARETLLAGFTTVRDVGTNRAFVDVALRDAINAGHVDGPRLLVAGAYITVSQGGGDIVGLAPDVVLPPDFRRGVANSVDEVRKRVRELLAGGADFIKVIATGAVLDLGYDIQALRVHAKKRSAPLWKKRPTRAPSSQPTPTARRASSAPCGQAYEPSSTAPISTTKASP